MSFSRSRATAPSHALDPLLRGGGGEWRTNWPGRVRPLVCQGPPNEPPIAFGSGQDYQVTARIIGATVRIISVSTMITKISVA
jgi:hypothetical protein